MKYYLSLLMAVVFSLSSLGQTRSIIIDQKHFSTEEQFNLSPAYPISDKTFQFLGISAYTETRNTKSEIEYRVKHNEKWLEWRGMKKFVEGVTPGRTVFEGSPYFGVADSLQVRTKKNENQNWVLRLFVADREGKETYEMNKASEPCKLQSYCSRRCWCDTCPKDPTPVSTIPTHLIIHHSAGFTTAPDYKQVVAYYWDFHVNTNGWDDIGYNWLIDPNGVIYEGRGHNTLGAHFSCMNSKSLGICLIGNYENQFPSDTSIGSLISLIGYEAYANNIDASGSSLHTPSQLFLPNISSHRDGNSATAPGSCPKGTACPGDSLYALLPQIRVAVDSLGCMEGISLYEQQNERYRFYPNPVTDELWIDGVQKKDIEGLYDSNGRKMKVSTTSKDDDRVRIDMSHLTRGMYFLRFESVASGVLKVFKK